VEVDQSLEELAQSDLQGRWNKPPTKKNIADWVELMTILLKDIRPGVTYTYFDGLYIPVDTRPVRFDGWHSRHDLAIVPHVEALTNPLIRKEVLASRDYWQTRAIETAR